MSPFNNERRWVRPDGWGEALKRGPVVIIRRRAGEDGTEESARELRRKAVLGEAQTSPEAAPKPSAEAPSGVTPRRASKKGPGRLAEVPSKKSAPKKKPGKSGGSPKAGQWKKEPESAEKVARRLEAQELAESAGIPIPQAHRILQGKTTLSEVLQGLVRKARLKSLIEDDGMDASLAGQVAAGNLTVERAKVIAEMRKLRPHSVAKDAFHLAAAADMEIGLLLFGEGWVRGTITKGAIYEITFQPTEGGEARVITKHDVKMLAMEPSDELENVLGLDVSVAGKALGGTKEATARTRIPDEVLLDAAASEEALRLVCRDGTTVKGQVVCFGRWDVELKVPFLVGKGETRIIVFNHALHGTHDADA